MDVINQKGFIVLADQAVFFMVQNKVNCVHVNNLKTLIDSGVFIPLSNGVMIEMLLNSYRNEKMQ